MDSSSGSDEEGPSSRPDNKSQWQLKPVLDGIFAEVDLNIPVLDSGSASESESDNEDDPFIFSNGGLKRLSSLVVTKETHSKEEDSSTTSETEELRGVSVSSADSGISTVGAGGEGTLSPSVLQTSVKKEDLEHSDLEDPKSPEKLVNLPSDQSTPTQTTTQVPHLNFSQIQDIDIDGLLRRLNEVCIPEEAETAIAEMNNNGLESDVSSSNSSEDLMVQLASLSQKHSEEAVDVPTITRDVVSSRTTGGVSVQNAGMMTAPYTASVGTSTPTSGGSRIEDEKATTHLDLRADQDRSIFKGVSLTAMEKLLGSGDDSASSSSEDEDLASWHEQRRKFKEESMAKTKTPTQKGKRVISPLRHQKRGESASLEKSKEDIKSSHDKRSSPNKKVPSEHLDVQEEERAELLLVMKEKTQSPAEQVNPGEQKHQNKSETFEHLKAGNEAIKTKITDKVARSSVSTGTEMSDLKPVKLAWEDTSSLSGGKHKESMFEEKEKIILEDGKQDVKSTIVHYSNQSKLHDREPLVNGITASEEVSVKKKTTEAKIIKEPKLTKTMQSIEKKEKKLRMKGMLERVKQQRETKSSSGKMPAVAPATPVVFDLEASYESAPATLPELESTKSYLLLTATLSSCGKLQVGGSKGTKGSTHRNSTDSASYNALLAWLLSLIPVPEELEEECVDYAAQYGVPFHVIGLQQTWHEGQLSLKIGICRRTEIIIRNGKQGKGNSFLTAVNKYLRTNTLLDVLPGVLQCTNALMALPWGQRNLSSILSVNPDPHSMSRVFGAEPGFYWQTYDVEDSSCEGSLTNLTFCGPEVENTMALIQYTAFHDPTCMQDVLSRVWRDGLDVAGVRLLYANTDGMSLDSSSTHVLPGGTAPLLALAIRGTFAVMRWLDVVGPLDVSLARRTDPISLRALYSQDLRDDRMFYCPRNTARANEELARWFGGRVPENDTVNFGSPDGVLDRPRPCDTRGRGVEQIPTSSLHTPLAPPPCTLTACSASSVVLISSPLVPTNFIGEILEVCYERGFALQGIRRIRLHPNRLKDNNRDVLGLIPAQVSVFCPINPPAERQKDALSRDSYQNSLRNSACTVMCLRRENGMHQLYALMSVVTDHLLQLQALPPEVSSKSQVMVTQLCFTSVPFTDHVLAILGHKMDQLPHSGIYSAAFLSHSFYSNPELEQVCVVTLLKEKVTQMAHEILRYLFYCPPPGRDPEEGYCTLELLGIKLITSMSLHQAKEFSPYEIGDKLWQSSLRPLTTGPALICALRGVNAFSRLRTFIHNYVGGSPKKQRLESKEEACPDLFMSPTPEIAYRQLTAVFHEHELHADYNSRSNLHMVPPPRQHARTRCDSPDGVRVKDKRPGWTRDADRKDQNAGKVETLSHNDVHIISSLLAGPRPFVSVCVVKPDAVPKYIGKVLRRLVREGFTVVNLKMKCLTQAEAKLLVSHDPDCRNNKEAHVCHMTSGPVLALSVQRENAVGKLLEVIGPSNPDEARSKSQFFLRGSYGSDRIRNALYASPTYSMAVRDTMLLFGEGLCCPQTIDLQAEEIPSLILDAIFEVKPKRLSVDVLASEAIPSCNSATDFFMDVLHLPASLLEVNCILLHPSLLQPQGANSPGRHPVPAYAEVIDAMTTAGLQPIAMRMLQLNETQAAQCARLYTESLNQDIKPYQLAFQLRQGPCVVMAVLKDGAVTSFNTLMESLGKNKSIATKYGRHIMAARTTTHARHLVECFFDSLVPNRKVRLQISD